MSILQEEHKYDLSSWEGELKKSKVNLFEKKETEKGLHQLLTPGEKDVKGEDVKDEDIKEEFFYIDTNGEYEKLPGPTTVLRERKGESNRESIPVAQLSQTKPVRGAGAGCRPRLPQPAGWF